MTTKEMEPHLFLIFGALGDLARRKLLPALYHLSSKGELGDDYYIVGVDVDEHLHDKGYRSRARQMLADAGLLLNDKASQWCDQRLYYHGIGQGNRTDYGELAAKLEALEKECGLPGNRVLYLALPADIVPATVASLGEAAGLEISVKTLRDTYARFLWQDTGDVGLLTERLGHRRPETVLKHISSPAQKGLRNGGS